MLADFPPSTETVTFMFGKKKVSSAEAARVFVTTTLQVVENNWETIKDRLRQYVGDRIDEFDDDGVQEEVWLATMTISLQAIDNLLGEKAAAIRSHIFEQLGDAEDDGYPTTIVTDYESRWQSAMKDGGVPLAPWDAIAGRFCERMGCQGLTTSEHGSALSPLMVMGVSQVLMLQAVWWKAFLENYQVR